MDLFDYMRNNTMKSEAPLASRMRPTTLDEIVGQQHIIGKDNCFIGLSGRINCGLSFSMDRPAQGRRR